MLSIKNNQVTFDRIRCCQCGVCLGSCPTQALRSAPWKGGVYNIVCDSKKCVACGLCVKVCPAHRLPEDFASTEQVRHAKSLFLAHARDSKIRIMASSGGVARTLLHEMLKSRHVDAAYSLVYPEGESSKGDSEKTDKGSENLMVTPTGIEPEGRWLIESPPPDRVPCSIYRPVLWGKDLKNIDKRWKSVLMIGLPCQLKGAKEFLSVIALKLEVINVAIFCRQQKTQAFTRYIKQILPKPAVPDELVIYRGQGWPGQTGTQEKSLNFTAAGSFAFGTYALWRVPGCRLCSDCLGASVADLTLGDPWNILTPDDDSSGTNIVFAWTDLGFSMISKLTHALDCRSIQPETALKMVSPDSLKRKTNAIPYYMGYPTARLLRTRLHMANLQRRLFEILLDSFGSNRLLRRVLSRIPFPFD